MRAVNHGLEPIKYTPYWPYNSRRIYVVNKDSEICANWKPCAELGAIRSLPTLCSRAPEFRRLLHLLLVKSVRRLDATAAAAAYAVDKGELLAVAVCIGADVQQDPRKLLVSAGAVMLEPLAASVLNSILAVRHAAASHKAHHVPAAVSAMRTMSRALPSDFFTPHPRRTKGKERARPDEVWRIESTFGEDGEASSNSGAFLPSRMWVPVGLTRVQLARARCQRAAVSGRAVRRANGCFRMPREAG